MDNVLKYNSKILVKGNKILTKTPIIAKSPEELSAVAWFTSDFGKTGSPTVSSWASKIGSILLSQSTSTNRATRDGDRLLFISNDFYTSQIFSTSLFDINNQTIVLYYQVTRDVNDASTTFNLKHTITSFDGTDTQPYNHGEHNDWFSSGAAYDSFNNIFFYNDGTSLSLFSYGKEYGNSKKILISTVNNGEVNLYLFVDNGPTITRSNNLGINSAQINQIIVGRRVGSAQQFMYGYIDDLSYYTYALTKNEINSLISFLSIKYDLTLTYL